MKKYKSGKFHIISIPHLGAVFSMFLLLLCSYVGVGFVSGAEIYEFFLRFGDAFCLGVVVFFALVWAVIYKMLRMSQKDDKSMFVKKSENSKVNAFFSPFFKQKISEFVFTINVFLISGAMFSGLLNFSKTIFTENYRLAYAIGLVVVFLILIFGVALLKKFDLIVLVFVLALSGFYIFQIKKSAFIPEGMTLKSGGVAIFFSTLYVFMNLLTMKPLIDASGVKLASKRECKVFSGVFSLFLTVLLIVFALMLKSYKNIAEFPMPFLKFFDERGGVLKIIFCAGLVTAIISTLVSSLICCKAKLGKLFKINNILLSGIAFAVCLIFGLFPFKFYVSVMYPLLGAINFLTMVFC